MRHDSVRTLASNLLSTGLASFIFFVISLALTSYTSKNKEALSLGKSVVAESIRPLSLLTYATYDGIRNIWFTYFDLVNLAKEKERLILRLNVLESVNARLVEVEKENLRLKSLVNAKEGSVLKTIYARVIGYDPSGWIQAVTINRGQLDGLKIGMAVIDGAGVVGQITSVSPNSAKVLLVIDRASSIDALIQDNRARGVLDGNGSKWCDFKYVNESEDVKVGDKLVTSGMDEIFPKGLVLGIVTSVNKSSGGLFKAIKVSPAVKFSRLEDVLVILEDGI